MIQHVDYIPIQEVLARVARNPLLKDIDIEAGVQYTLDFFGLLGVPNLYVQKHAEISIEEYRGKLPCDVVIVDQVRDEKTGLCLRAMTDNFNGMSDNISSEASYKTKGKFIYTSFKTGKVTLAYQAAVVDEEGFPMLPSNAVFLKALEDYIKVQMFTTLFECGRLSGDVLAHAEDTYARSAAKCQNAFTIPSVSEMQAISGMMHRLIPSRNEFRKGFKTLGDREYYKKH